MRKREKAPKRKGTMSRRDRKCLRYITGEVARLAVRKVDSGLPSSNCQSQRKNYNLSLIYL